MLYDTHMHTTFSTDSRMTMEEALVRGRELNIGITVTEHLDLDYPLPKAFIFDIDSYFAAYEKYRSDTVRLGIEIGMRPDLLRENREVLRDRPFDYVIGSIHLVDKLDIYQEGFYRGRTKQEVYSRYFAAMSACVECYDFIDSLGHIDYIARYARFADPEIYCAEFADQLDGVLRCLAEKEKAIEINTRRLVDKGAVGPLTAIYKRFYELGGRLATIGSDAHRPQDIGAGLDTALAIAAASGLKPVWFKNHQPQYMRI